MSNRFKPDDTVPPPVMTRPEDRPLNSNVTPLEPPVEAVRNINSAPSVVLDDRPVGIRKPAELVGPALDVAFCEITDT